MSNTVFVSFPYPKGVLQIPSTGEPLPVKWVKQKIHEEDERFDEKSFYLVHNGKLVGNTDIILEGSLHVIPRLRGGKGGFGSMLRAIGAQIEKTTNREACRDLSGRRLRDINEEKRLKNWIAQQAEREAEAAERRRKKLERLCAEPKHEFKDASYEQERAELVEKVCSAVEQGMKAATSQSSEPGPSHKRKLNTAATVAAVKKKKSALWLDDIDEDELSSSLDSDSEDEIGKKESEGNSKAKESGISCSSDPESSQSTPAEKQTENLEMKGTSTGDSCENPEQNQSQTTTEPVGDDTTSHSHSSSGLSGKDT